jgi:hypothetical protein
MISGTRSRHKETRKPIRKENKNLANNVITLLLTLKKLLIKQLSPQNSN